MVDVAALTQDAAKQLLYERYWLAAGADQLPPALAAVHGDSAVNFGVKAAQGPAGPIGRRSEQVSGPARGQISRHRRAQL